MTYNQKVYVVWYCNDGHYRHFAGVFRSKADAEAYVASGKADGYKSGYMDRPFKLH